MEYKKQSEPLSIDQIEFRVQSINKGGYATMLAYKDARADMNRLDDVCGVAGWKREHSRDNKNCTVSVWCDIKKQWISKEDTGTESNADAEKGLASDSFKRACFNLGIGRELYDYPVIFIKLNANEFKLMENGKVKATWDLNLREWKWISEFRNGRLLGLACRDGSGKLRFKYGEFTPQK